MLHEQFFWPKMKHDVYNFLANILNVKRQSRSQPNGLYTLLDVPDELWTNISMNFVFLLLYIDLVKWLILLHATK